MVGEQMIIPYKLTRGKQKIYQFSIAEVKEILGVKNLSPTDEWQIDEGCYYHPKLDRYMKLEIEAEEKKNACEVWEPYKT